jgi:hypothetical protein
MLTCFSKVKRLTVQVGAFLVITTGDGLLKHIEKQELNQLDDSCIGAHCATSVRNSDSELRFYLSE